jgi:hypothetical protein
MYGTYLKEESLLGLVIQIPFKVGQLLPHLLAGFFFLLGRLNPNYFQIKHGFQYNCSQTKYSENAFNIVVWGLPQGTPIFTFLPTIRGQEAEGPMWGLPPRNQWGPLTR